MLSRQFPSIFQYHHSTSPLFYYARDTDPNNDFLSVRIFFLHFYRQHGTSNTHHLYVEIHVSSEEDVCGIVSVQQFQCPIAQVAIVC